MDVNVRAAIDVDAVRVGSWSRCVVGDGGHVQVGISYALGLVAEIMLLRTKDQQ